MFPVRERETTFVREPMSFQMQQGKQASFSSISQYGGKISFDLIGRLYTRISHPKPISAKTGYVFQVFT